MQALTILCCLLVVGHVATVFAVMLGMAKISKEFRQIVLEREETHRSMYAIGPDVETDSSDENRAMEYM
mgnify:CR=1 FL=1